MINQFSALNESSCSSSSNKRDGLSTLASSSKRMRLAAPIDEEAHHHIYTEALKHYGRQNYDQSKRMFKEILDSDEIGRYNPKDHHIMPKVHYNSLKYLGLIHYQSGDYADSMSCLLRATELDKSDVVLLFKLALAASRVRDYHIARAAAEQALVLSPNHWPSLDILINLTFKLGDHPSCLCYVAKALERNPGYPKALKFRRMLTEEPIEFIVEPLDLPPPPPPKVNQVFFEDFTFEDLFKHLNQTAEDYSSEQLTELVSVEYRAPVSTAISVSVQNVVADMVDIVSKSSALELAEFIVDQLLDEVVIFVLTFSCELVLCKEAKNTIS